MKKYGIFFLTGVLILCLTVFSATAADKEAIQKQVDEIVAAMDGGKTVDDFKDAASRQPYYVFIMQEDGMLLVHPSLMGKSLKDSAAPVFDAVAKATPEGLWVDYEWQGKMKHSYVRKTGSALIVGSGYSD